MDRILYINGNWKKSEYQFLIHLFKSSYRTDYFLLKIETILLVNSPN